MPVRWTQPHCVWLLATQPVPAKACAVAFQKHAAVLFWSHSPQRGPTNTRSMRCETPPQEMAPGGSSGAQGFGKMRRPASVALLQSRIASLQPASRAAPAQERCVKFQASARDADPAESAPAVKLSAHCTDSPPGSGDGCATQPAEE